MRAKTIFITLALLAISLACSMPNQLLSREEQISMIAEKTVEAYFEEQAAAEAVVVAEEVVPAPTATPQSSCQPCCCCDNDRWDCDHDRDYGCDRSCDYNCDYDCDRGCDHDHDYDCDRDRDWDCDDDRPCYYALLIGELVPDGSDFAPGEAFLKQWSLRNTGSCTWQPDMRLVFVSGDQMSGPDSVRLDDYVEPDDYGAFSVDLVAPADVGRHTGYWMLQTAEGIRFAKIYVKIDVE